MYNVYIKFGSVLVIIFILRFRFFNNLNNKFINFILDFLLKKNFNKVENKLLIIDFI